VNVGIETPRAGLRLTIHRGGVGNRPNRLSASAPVAEDETILSGMVMTVVRNATLGRNEWVRGVTGSSQPNSYYIAVDDSTDGDVVTSGNLQGLSVRGDYEVSTSQFKSGESYVVGDALTPDAATGKLKKATASDVVIAHVVKDYLGPVDLAASFTSLKPDPATTQSTGVQGGIYRRPRETNAADLHRLRIELVPPYTL
jgi:hypothetical protein